MQFYTLLQRRKACLAALASLSVLALLLSFPTAGAVEVSSLYTVEVPLDPAEPQARDSAYRTALGVVLVRVTGTTAAAESADLASQFPDPNRFVLSYRDLPDGMLAVSLDGPAIERILRQNNATIWGNDRPLTLVLLGVDRGQGDREIVAAEASGRVPGTDRIIDRNKLLRERIESQAELRGLPVVFPILDSADLEGLSFADLWGGFDERLLATAARYGATSVLVGKIRPDSMLEQRWTWYHAEQRRDWSGHPDQAVNMLGDSLAAMYAVGGDAAVEKIQLTISGVNSVVAYGEIQQLLENLRGIDKIAVLSATADSMSYEVTVQGGSDRLVRALAQSGILDPVVSPGSAIDLRAIRRREDAGSNDIGTYQESVVLEYLYRSD